MCIIAMKRMIKDVVDDVNFYRRKAWSRLGQAQPRGGGGRLNNTSIAPKGTMVVLLK